MAAAPRRSLTRHPYQDLIVHHEVDGKRDNEWAGMGMGKTSATLAAVDVLDLAGEIRRTLVLAPLRVAKTTWPQEAAKWEEFERLRVQPIIGTDDERRAALRNDKAHIYTINYDNLPWLVERCGAHWPWDMVVADESTALKSFRFRQGGVRAQSIAHHAWHSVRRWVNLTGTPSPNGLIDLWGQNWFVDKGKRLGRTFTDFQNEFFGYQRAKQALDTQSRVKRIIFPYAQDIIQKRLADVCLTLNPKDWFDIKDPIERVIEVELPATARKHYRELERELYTKLISGHEIEVFNAGGKSLKCLQCASGALYVEPDADSDDHPKAKKWVVVHDEKIEALKSIIAEAAGMPVLVAYHFKSDLARLQKAFPHARVLDDKTATQNAWNRGEIDLLLAHPASAGHGLNLQDGGNILVYFSHWWDLEKRQQILERIGPMRQLQSGHDRPVWVYYIVAKDTFDEDVIDRTDSKATVQQVLLGSMKRRRS
jgi:SNF2 family DNA or RNA helicase